MSKEINYYNYRIQITFALSILNIFCNIDLELSFDELDCLLQQIYAEKYIIN